MQKIALFYLSFLFTSCSIANKSNSVSSSSDDELSNFLIAPYTINSLSNPEQKALLVKENDRDNWRYFNDSIINFEHNPGICYHLEVRTTCIESPTNDTPSITYELVNILSSSKYNPDPICLYDIWGVIEFNALNARKLQHEVTIEINTHQNTILGTNGCNHYSGLIDRFPNTNHIKFKDITSTNKACEHPDLEKQFISALDQVDAFFRLNQQLILLSDNKAVIRCKRMD
ncbi:DUF4377 domain-containing protein [Carboxylicivirga sp. M1479]|uniref:DUF4377 domain-containing protein n=1 Tax=Carboxylicivirga sp. M1479 TaxID=2594476 RepID=UPI001178B054|nr:DUF4377 domain-containing protein [Carboxylicivirga sp. M1479]TRX61566.1 DUF4377 domain-containing protein [Carboxylicivirga sp. M1479]